MDAAAAYRRCAAITRSRAGNFYYGIRLLPPDKRGALCAVYAFARRVDDIGDGALREDEKLDRLEGVRRSAERIDPASPDPVLAALGHAVRRFPLPLQALSELIDGVEMDVRGVTYQRFDDLEVYCRRVAGTIGRLSTAVFGAAEPSRAAGLSDDLGVAMQLTNILRDLREDAAYGRVYVPREDRDLFGATLRPFEPPRPDPNLLELVRFEVDRARIWFGRGLELVPLLDPRSAACAQAMTGIYRRILDRIESTPWRLLQGRISLPVWEKAWVAARSVARSSLDGHARVPGRLGA